MPKNSCKCKTDKKPIPRLITVLSMAEANGVPVDVMERTIEFLGISPRAYADDVAIYDSGAAAYVQYQIENFDAEGRWRLSGKKNKG